MKMLTTMAVLAASMSTPTATEASSSERLGKRYSVTSTAYCLSGRMANGRYVHHGAVANNFLPLGTRIRTSRRVFGRRYFRVEDRIGYGTALDFWTGSCGQARAWGRRRVSFRVVRGR